MPKFMCTHTVKGMTRDQSCLYPRQRQEGGATRGMRLTEDEMSWQGARVEVLRAGRLDETVEAPGWLGPAGRGRKGKFLSVTVKDYLALVHGVVREEAFVIDAPPGELPVSTAGRARR